MAAVRVRSAMRRRAIIWRWQNRQGYFGSRLPILLDDSANAKPLPLCFHRAHLSLRDQENKMKTINQTSSDTAPALERVTVNWRRFSLGLWRVPEGDIAAAYSASTLPKVSVFIHEGRWFTNGGGFSQRMHTELNCYPLIPADEYHGADVVPYSYEGREATHKGKSFRLGAKVLFVSSDPTVDEWRGLLRVLYAEGGYFAANCTYGGFLANRFAPDSENGRKAWFEELAECGGRVMPRTQEEMLHLLARETATANQPLQMDFAL